MTSPVAVGLAVVGLVFVSVLAFWLYELHRLVDSVRSQNATAAAIRERIDRLVRNVQSSIVQESSRGVSPTRRMAAAYLLLSRMQLSEGVEPELSPAEAGRIVAQLSGGETSAMAAREDLERLSGQTVDIESLPRTVRLSMYRGCLAALVNGVPDTPEACHLLLSLGEELGLDDETIEAELRSSLAVLDSNGAEEERARSRAQARKLLRIDPGAGRRELREQYRSRINLFHPDRADGPLERTVYTEVAKRVNWAYDFLRDDRARREEVSSGGQS